MPRAAGRRDDSRRRRARGGIHAPHRHAREAGHGRDAGVGVAVVAELEVSPGTFTRLQ